MGISGPPNSPQTEFKSFLQGNTTIEWIDPSMAVPPLLSCMVWSTLLQVLIPPLWVASNVHNLVLNSLHCLTFNSISLNYLLTPSSCHLTLTDRNRSLWSRCSYWRPSSWLYITPCLLIVGHSHIAIWIHWQKLLHWLKMINYYSCKLKRASKLYFHLISIDRDCNITLF